MARRPTLFAVLTAVAVLVAGCSSGGGKQSTPTTVSRPTTTTLAGPTGYESGGRGFSVLRDVIASLVPCPKVYPSLPANVNPGIKGLDKKLVPISAIAVRICEYVENGDGVGTETPPFRLIASGVLTTTAAQLVDHETNRLRTKPKSGGCAAFPTGYRKDVFILTFADHSQRVHVSAFGGCGSTAMNGAFAAEPTTKWLNDLQHYTSRVDPRLGTTGPQG
jgi:hypothetical protein